MKGCPAGAGATPWLVSSLAHTAGTEECDRAQKVVSVALTSGRAFPETE